MPAFLSLFRAACAAMTLACACFPVPLLAGAIWRQPAVIAYDNAASPLADAEVQAALQYAAAAWAARIDLQLSVEETRPGAGYQAGRIVVRWIDSLEQVKNGASILGLASTRRWTWAATQSIAGAEIFLNRHSRLRSGGPCLTHAILHEVGHALGIAHLADATALMHANPGTCHGTVTAADIAAAPYPQHGCHAELLPNFDIYIPALNAGTRSYSGWLRHVDGMWKVQDYRESAFRPDCHEARLEDGYLVLERLWSPGATWHIELQPTDDGAMRLLFAL